MRLIRWELRELPVQVEYEIEATTLQDAIKKLKKADETGERYKLKKSLYHFDIKAVEFYLQENKPVFTDSTQYWKELK